MATSEKTSIDSEEKKSTSTPQSHTSPSHPKFSIANTSSSSPSIPLPGSLNNGKQVVVKSLSSRSQNNVNFSRPANQNSQNNSNSQYSLTNRQQFSTPRQLRIQSTPYYNQNNYPRANFPWQSQVIQRHYIVTDPITIPSRPSCIQSNQNVVKQPNLNLQQGMIMSSLLEQPQPHIQFRSNFPLQSYPNIQQHSAISSAIVQPPSSVNQYVPNLVHQSQPNPQQYTVPPPTINGSIPNLVHQSQPNPQQYHALISSAIPPSTSNRSNQSTHQTNQSNQEIHDKSPFNSKELYQLIFSRLDYKDKLDSPEAHALHNKINQSLLKYNLLKEKEGPSISHLTNAVYQHLGKFPRVSTRGNVDELFPAVSQNNLFNNSKYVTSATRDSEPNIPVEMFNSVLKLPASQEEETPTIKSDLQELSLTSIKEQHIARKDKVCTGVSIGSINDCKPNQVVLDVIDKIISNGEISEVENQKEPAQEVAGSSPIHEDSSQQSFLEGLKLCSEMWKHSTGPRFTDISEIQEALTYISGSAYNWIDNERRFNYGEHRSLISTEDHEINNGNENESKDHSNRSDENEDDQNILRGANLGN